MRFEIKDVVMTLPEFGEREFAILDIIEDQYYTVAIKTKKRYWLEESQISHKTGIIHDGDPILQLDSYNQKEGREYALAQMSRDKTNAAKWEYLAKLKQGNIVEILYKKFQRPATFVKINLKKPLLVIRVNVEGTIVDLSLESLVIPTKI